ncbi:MAG: TetR/AcrR family transcriptional regulator [Acidobacteria bacterium]|nr:TetR/AcrR family transcriptional regulator [Acidobacteriota bacterium]
MGIKERQERDRQAVRTAILDAARDLFVAEGYRNVSMRKVAERVEYSPAALYGYFPNKDAIFFALAEEGFRLLAAAERAATTAQADPCERLRLALRAFSDFAHRHPQYFELMFLDRSVPSLDQDPQRFAFFRDTTARAEACIRACIEDGRFSQDLDPAAALRILWAAVLGAATAGLGRRLSPGEDVRALARDVLEAVLAGFTTPLRTTFIVTPCPVHPAGDAEAPLPAAEVPHHAS